MRTRSRRYAALCALVLAAAWSGPAGGQPRDAARSGYEVVDAADPAASSVTLGSTVYRVTPQTELRGPAGRPIGLGDLRTLADGPGRPADAVRFEATRDARRGGWVLELLQVVEHGPA